MCSTFIFIRIGNNNKNKNNYNHNIINNKNDNNNNNDESSGGGGWEVGFEGVVSGGNGRVVSVSVSVEEPGNRKVLFW